MAAALVASAAAASPNDPRRWRRTAHAPPLPYPYAVHPQEPGVMPRLHLHRHNGAPVTPYPGALYPTNPPLPASGFTMTVERDLGVGGAPQVVAASASTEPAAAPSDDPNAPMDRPRQIAERLSGCWNPAAPPSGETYEVTLRMSFNRSGTVIGAPRVTYVKGGARKEDQDELRASILDAVRTCAPLRFTPGLASAIAGRMFAIRFVASNRAPSDPPAL